MKHAVIFDFDGTIADSLPAVIQVFEDLIGRTERFTPEEVEACRDMSVPELMKWLRIPKWKAPILLFRGRKMLRDHLHGIPVHEGMADAIKKLHKDGISLYVLSSNSTENVRQYLQRHKLLDCFDGVYGGASILGKAPLLLRMMSKEKIAVTKSWYVGDEMRDVSAARAVHLNIVSVSWGYNTHAALASKNPNVIVDTAAELLKTLEHSWKK